MSNGRTLVAAQGWRSLVLLAATLAAAPLGARLAGAQQPAAPADHPTATVLPDTAAITPQMIERGRALFRSRGQCVVCHGPRLEGTPVAPTLRAHAWKDAAGGSLVELYRVITHGVPNTAMVAHPGGVSDESAALLAVYVWSVSRGTTKP